MQEQPLTREQYAAETTEQTTERVFAQIQSSKKTYVKTALFDEKRFRETLPPEMLKAKRWMRYFLKPKPDGGGTAKIPLGDHGKSETWSYFDDAVAALETGKEQGLGYAFLGGEIFAFDVDHCRNATTGIICNEAMLLLSRLPSWAEYSVSGQGIHVFGYDSAGIRGKQLSTQHLQFWNAANSPRFFALTCEMVGDAFTKLKDWNGQGNYVFSDAKRISAKINEELRVVDPEQWAALPVEREVAEPVTREKSKTKSRKVAAGFDIKDFLTFYGLPIDNETDNELGHCIRLTTCPLKGEAHVGHNSTTCNFIYPCKDGGLAYHCQSTGCVEYGIKEALEALEKEKGPYPKPIYEEKADGGVYKVEILSHRASTIKSETWEWVVTGYLPKGAEVHLFAGKGRGKTKICNYFNKLANDQGMRVIRFNMEDHEASILKPTMYAAGCNLELTEVVDRSAMASKDGRQMPTSIDFSRPEFVAALEELVTKFGDVGLVIIEPINNYKGKSKAISEDDMRPIHTAIATLAEKLKVCILAVSHTNRKKDVDIQEKAHGAGSGINVARVNLYLDKDPDGDPDERILADAGSNIKVGKSIVFKIVEQPPFELDGVTHKEIAVAVFDRETDTSGQDLLERGDSPAKQSQAKDIEAMLTEYLTGKNEIRKDVVMNAAKQFNKEWSEDNITKVFSRRMRKVSHSRTEGGGKNKATFWSLGKKEHAALVFDRNTPPEKELYA